MKELGKIFFGAAIQGAVDRSLRAPVNARIINSIQSLGYSVISEHTTGRDFDDTAGKLEQVIGPLPPVGKERTIFIRNQMIALIESEITAAVFEVSVPSLGTGIEVAHAYLRPRMGLPAIPVVALYQKGFWPNGLSAMIAGIIPEKVPGFHLLEYEREEEIAGILKPALTNSEMFIEKGGSAISLNAQGRVTARKCAHCGHHELCLLTDAGEFVALKPGMMAEVK